MWLISHVAFSWLIFSPAPHQAKRMNTNTVHGLRQKDVCPRTRSRCSDAASVGIKPHYGIGAPDSCTTTLQVARYCSPFSSQPEPSTSSSACSTALHLFLWPRLIGTKTTQSCDYAGQTSTCSVCLQNSLIAQWRTRRWHWAVCVEGKAKAFPWRRRCSYRTGLTFNLDSDATHVKLKKHEKLSFFKKYSGVYWESSSQVRHVWIHFRRIQFIQSSMPPRRVGVCKNIQTNYWIRKWSASKKKCTKYRHFYFFIISWQVIYT